MNETVRMPDVEEQAALDTLQVRLLEGHELKQCNQLLDQHHYLKSPKPVGERLYYVVSDHQGQWLGLLLFAAAARHLKHRDRWIGWTDAQRERRLSLVVNNIRFLLLPDKTFANLGTKALRMVLARLSIPTSFVAPFILLMAGRNWDRPTVPDGINVIIMFGTISRSGSLYGSFAATPAAVCKPNTSSRHWPWWKPRHGQGPDTRSKRLARWSSASSEFPTSAPASSLIRCGPC